MAFAIGAEDEHEDYGEARDEGDRRPEDAVYCCGNSNNLEYCIAVIVWVVVACEQTIPRHSVSLKEILHWSNVVYCNAITSVVGALQQRRKYN